MNHMRWFPVVVILCLSGFCEEATAARNWESLRDVKGLEVVIGDLNPSAVQDGLNQQLLYADVLRSLGMAGIQVLTRDHYKIKSPISPWT